MPIIKFIEHSGAEHAVHADVGQSAMQAAINNQVPGILADCGGSCSCATCHGYVAEAWVSHLPPPEQYELDMLSCAMDLQDNSRLTCQIHITPELDGLVIHLPRSQT